MPPDSLSCPSPCCLGKGGWGPEHTWLEVGIRTKPEFALCLRILASLTGSNSQLSVQQMGVGWHGKWADIPALPEMGSAPYANNSRLGGIGLCCPLVVRPEQCTLADRIWGPLGGWL